MTAASSLRQRVFGLPWGALLFLCLSVASLLGPPSAASCANTSAADGSAAPRGPAVSRSPSRKGDPGARLEGACAAAVLGVQPPASDEDNELRRSVLAGSSPAAGSAALGASQLGELSARRCLGPVAPGHPQVPRAPPLLA